MNVIPYHSPNRVLLVHMAEYATYLQAYEIKAARVRNIPAGPPNSATIPITGLLLPSVPPDWLEWGFDATGYDAITQAVTEAANDTAVEEIYLWIDSGGGYVQGVAGAADAIYAARQVKPVHAIISGMGASAAYWLASQATDIQAVRLSDVGGIGVYQVMYDDSKMLKDMGVAAKIVRSGPHKGVGAMGVPITDDNIEVEQQNVNEVAALFVDAVARGRGVSVEKVREWATGRVWIAESAANVGLIDAVCNGEISSPTQKEFKAMSEDVKDKDEAETEEEKEEEKEQAKAEEEKEDEQDSEEEDEKSAVQIERERCAAILKSIPDHDFAMAQIAGGATITEAKAAYCDVLIKQGNSQAKTSGAQPISVSETETDAAPVGFLACARVMAEEEKIPLHVAAAKIAKQQPDLYRAYIGG